MRVQRLTPYALRESILRENLERYDTSVNLLGGTIPLVVVELPRMGFTSANREAAWHVSAMKRISLYRFFMCICAKASAMSLLRISSAS